MSDSNFIDVLQRPRNIYFIGDSHVLIYKNQLFNNDLDRKSFFIHTHYIEGLESKSFYNQEKKCLHPYVIAGLKNKNLYGHANARSSFWLSEGRIENVMSYEMREPSVPPILVFSCGDIDFRLDIVKPLAEKYKEDENFRLSNIPASLLLDIIENQFNPLLDGLIALRKQGFRNIHLLAIPYPTCDADEYNNLNSFSINITDLFELTRKVNEFLFSKCTEQKINFIDVGSFGKSQKLLNGDFYLDGGHYSHITVPIVLQQIFSWIYKMSPGFCNYKRYEFLAKQINKEVTEFDESGIFISNIMEFGKKQFSYLVSEFDARLPFENLKPDVDWAGPALGIQNSNIHYMAIDEKYLSYIYDLFFSSKLKNKIENIIGNSFYIGNCRAYRSSPHNEAGHGPQAFHKDSCPVGVKRGILYLTDVDSDSGPFQYRQSDGTIKKITGKAGTFILFDADKLEHCADVPKVSERKALDFVFVNRREDMPLIAIASDINYWPLDPYCFSLKGVTYLGSDLGDEYVIRADISMVT